MIYLTDYRYACTENVELIEGLRFPQKVNWFPETYQKVNLGVNYAPHKLAEKVLDYELILKIKNNPVKTAFIFASGNSHLAGINPRPVPQNALSYTYKFLPFTLTQVYAGRIAQSFGEIDYIATDASACASSLKVMMDVQVLMNFYDFERVIVLSFEDAVTNSVLDFFGESKASLSLEDEQKGKLPSAFDDINGGFHVGQGAVLAIFENERIAQTPKLQLISAYTASENSKNAIGQREDGEGYKKAIKGCLDVCGLSSSEISIIKTHGTGTMSNNQAEKDAIESFFTDFIATSYKPKIGHTMGASGLLETCLLYEDIKKGKVPKILNKTNKDSRYLSEDVSVPEGLIMCLASGMGNIYSSGIFGVMHDS